MRGMVVLLVKFTVVWFIGAFLYIALSNDNSGQAVTESLEFYFIIIGLYLLYRLIKGFKNDLKHGKVLEEKLKENRDAYAKSVNKEIYYFNEYRAIAFNNNTKKFEYLKIELPNGEKYKKSGLFTSEYNFDGYTRHFKDDFFSECTFEYYPIKSIGTDTQYITQTVASHNVDIISKQRHVNKTTAINQVILTLENDAQFEFNTDGCKDVQFMNFPCPKFLMNKDTQGVFFPSFSSYYEKYALKVVK